jgi:tetratricopeptide (TPR) repeat protein
MRKVGLRSRWPRRQVTVAVVGVIVAGGAAAVAKWPHAWWWLIAVTAVVAAVMPSALAVLSDASRRRHEIGQAARSALQGTSGVVGDKLPTVATANLEVHVHQTILVIPYIHRDEEETIRAHLRAKRPVLLIGSSMVGKTKMAARVITEEFSSWPVAIPDSKTALADLDAKDVTLHDSVIWLDDIDRLIGAGGITDGALRRLAASGNVVVGTIRARSYEQLQPSDQVRLPEWDVLCVFERVFVKRDLSQREQERLADAVADPEIRYRIQTVGLGEYVGAARQVAEALELGSAGTDPLGYALVLAAADWRRCGMADPIPASILTPLARPHLDSRGQARLADQDSFNAGLAWAIRDINPNVALLQPAGAGSYDIYDYALELISAQGKPISDSTWAVVIVNADPEELIRIGHTAAATYNRSEIAIQALRKAANSKDADSAAYATYMLGVRLKDQGDVLGAKEAFQKAIDSGRPRALAVATYGLWDLLRDDGYASKAREVFQKAIDSGDVKAAVDGAVCLVMMLLRQENVDVPGAREACKNAIYHLTRLKNLLEADTPPLHHDPENARSNLDSAL